jgi:hypothetical protein
VDKFPHKYSLKNTKPRAIARRSIKNGNTEKTCGMIFINLLNNIHGQVKKNRNLSETQRVDRRGKTPFGKTVIDRSKNFRLYSTL